MSFLLPAGGATVSAYAVLNSGDFERSESDKLSWTPSSEPTGGEKTLTLSCWFKRESISQAQTIFHLKDSEFHFPATNKFQWFDPTTALTTTATHTDTSNFHHYLLAHDSTLATAGDRSRFYVDGVEITAFDADNPIALDGLTGAFQNGALIDVGTSVVAYIDGKLAEVAAIDGLQLTPASFRDPVSGLAIDLEPLTFGTNGFWLKFQNSGDLGEDSSGNGNDFTNSGVTQSSDVPT